MHITFNSFYRGIQASYASGKNDEVKDTLQALFKEMKSHPTTLSINNSFTMSALSDGEEKKIYQFATRFFKSTPLVPKECIQMLDVLPNKRNPQHIELQQVRLALLEHIDLSSDTINKSQSPKEILPLMEAVLKKEIKEDQKKHQHVEKTNRAKWAFVGIGVLGLGALALAPLTGGISLVVFLGAASMAIFSGVMLILFGLLIAPLGGYGAALGAFSSFKQATHPAPDRRLMDAMEKNERLLVKLEELQSDQKFHQFLAQLDRFSLTDAEDVEDLLNDYQRFLDQEQKVG